jgi:hypothetical protein
VRAQSTEQQGEVVDKRAGRSTYRPASYTELVDDAVAAVAVAVSDGLTRLEVEFPAVSNVDGERRQGGCQLFFAHCILCASCYTCTANASSAGYKGASDLYIDANIQLALAASRKVRVLSTGLRRPFYCHSTQPYWKRGISDQHAPGLTPYCLPPPGMRAVGRGDWQACAFAAA